MDIERFFPAERLTAQAQTKLLPSEYDRLIAARDSLLAQGASSATVSSVIRSFVVEGLERYEAEQAEQSR